MLRTIYTFGGLGLYLIGSLPMFARVKIITKKGRDDDAYKMIEKKAHKLVDFTDKLTGLTLDMTGNEKIPDGPVLFVANHQGLYDALIMLIRMKNMNGFFIKKEAQTIPILSDWMRQIGCVFVDREDPKAALGVIRDGIDIINSGKSLVVFPEGTRSKDGNLNEFKGGAFKVAQKTGCPVIPVAIDGTRHIFEEKKRIQKSNVTVRILDPITDVDKMSRAEYKALPERVQGLIQAELDEIRKK